MAYEARLSAVTGSDWSEAIEFYDENGAPLAEIDDASIELAVRDRCNSTVLSASTGAGTITRPATGQIRWRFTKEQLSALCAGTTYGVGLRAITDGGTIALVVGSLAILDGEFA